MADVRAMLRASRDAARQKITHPYASYSLDGQQLSCGLCEMKIKHESAWKSHLHTTQHKLRQTRAQEVARTRDAGDGQSRKRKASPSTSPRPEGNMKKARSANPGAKVHFAEADVGEEDADVSREAVEHADSARNAPDVREQQNGRIEDAPGIQLATSAASNDAATSAELDDFERELAALDAAVPAPITASATATAATISSAPLTAAELAARAREEQSAQRGRRDAELADEKEDAARFLEEEFEEMESLEERAKTLRARREALRAQSEKPSAGPLANGGDASAPPATVTSGDHTGADAGKIAEGDRDDDDDDDDDDDEDEYWNFGTA